MNREWVSDSLCAGLELEYEGVPHRRGEERYVNNFSKQLLAFKNDGSLRPRDANTEITFSGPLAGSLIDEALEQLAAVLGWHKYRISWRCGMHVHIDCRGIEFVQPYRAAVIATLLEPVLFAWDNAGRNENKFCQSIVDSIYSYVPQANKSSRGLPVTTKYSLLNLHSLFRLGTLELRFAAATFDMDRVAGFINLGMGLREAGGLFKSAEDVIVSMLEMNSIESWLETFTHPLVAEQLIPVVRNISFKEPSAPALNAGLLLAEHERGIQPTIIGGR